MDSYIRASGFVLYPCAFVAGPNKHDCSRHYTEARKILTVMEVRSANGQGIEGPLVLVPSQVLEAFLVLEV